MDFKFILDDIKPTDDEKLKVKTEYEKLSNYLNKLLKDENIDAYITVVGSVSKGTYLKGKSDIDIFIAFPLDTPVDYLKETGLYLGHKCSDFFNGNASEHFASHPYVTSIIDGFEVDFVPCYQIEDASQLKSAVDRTILHTRFVKQNLDESQKDDVLLLKRFMDMTGTYGSEFKVGGFAGYLCELLIIKYGNFIKTLEIASNWKYGEVIDLKEYNTPSLFNDPLIVIDPTDMNRNVAAALRLDKMAEFIQASRNFLNSSSKKDYFYPAENVLSEDEILNEFKNRQSGTILIKFKIPEIPLDTLHPQLRKTTESLTQKLEDNDFKVVKADYWSDEKEYALFLFELSVFKLNSVKTNIGPKIYIKQACANFIKKYGIDKCYIKDDFIAVDVEREFRDALQFIKFVFTDEHISLIKVGKNLANNIIDTYEVCDLYDFDLNEDILIFLTDFLNPSRYISR